LPTPEHLEVAELFLRNAASDLAAARTLAADAQQLDDVVGFHAQQAVEKAVKAALAVREIDIPRTHDLAFLVELAGERGVPVAESLKRAEWLTPWAVTSATTRPGRP
jgi:HEPN domain-containing protein